LVVWTSSLEWCFDWHIKREMCQPYKKELRATPPTMPSTAAGNASRRTEVIAAKEREFSKERESMLAALSTLKAKQVDLEKHAPPLRKAVDDTVGGCYSC
jgi:hypothetical protein